MSDGAKNAAIFAVGAAAGAAAVLCLTKVSGSGTKVASGSKDAKQLRRTTAVSASRTTLSAVNPTDPLRALHQNASRGEAPRCFILR